MKVYTEWGNRPATYVIDRDGIIQFAKKGTAFNDRPSTGEIVKVLDQLSDGK